MVDRYRLRIAPAAKDLLVIDKASDGDFVLHSDFVELAAKNERLEARNIEHEMRFEAEEAKSEYWRDEALSRTGAVKVLPATGEYVDRLIRIFRDQPYDDTSAVVLQDYARAALEPAAPEAQQEPAIPRAKNAGRYLAELNDGRLLYLNHANEWQECPNFLTRPVEQAVTEAGIEAAARLITKWLGYSWDGLHDGRVTDKGFPVFLHHSQTGWKFQGHKGDMIDLARAALKAAMEAGR